MSERFGPGIEHRRPRGPSPAAFIIAGLVIVGLLAATVAWIEVERHHGRAARLDAQQTSDRQLFLAQTLAAIACIETTERELRSEGGADVAAHYIRARAAVDRQVERVAATERSPAAQPVIRGMRALIAARFAAADAMVRGHVVRPGAPAIAIARREFVRSRAIQRAGAALGGFEGHRLVDDVARADGINALIGRIFWTISSIVIVAPMLGLWLWWRTSQVHYRLEHHAFDTLARLRAVFAATSDAIVILAPDGRIEEANAAAQRLLGHPAGSLDGRAIATILDIDASDIRSATLATTGHSDGPSRIERVARHRDGNTIPVEVTLGSMPVPGGTRLVASLRDISERKAVERMKDDFISTISHELRTPLTSVVGALGLLRAGAAGVLPDAAARLTDIAENNARRLIRLVNDILDIDRLGSGRMRLDQAAIDLRDVAARARDDAEGIAAPRDVRIAIDRPDDALIVSGDAERLLQVIGNLLANAVRFSPAGGRITLGVEARGGEALIRVDDEGPGVPAEFRDRLFGRFTQSSAGAAIPGGTGLGLAISREIVRAHDGDIWYADRRGGGARFCVSLPLTGGARIEARRRLLLCEDDTLMAALLREMIEDDGYIVDRCGSAAEARTMARSGRYDVLLLDLSLPDADGLDAIRSIRDQPETRTLPVVVISGSASDRRTDAAAQTLGVVDWIDKPVDHHRLARALDSAIADADGNRPVLLHVEDDADVRAVVALALAGRGRILQAGSLASARAALAACTPAAVILDLDLPDGSGLALLPELAGDADPDAARATGRAARIPTVVYSAGLDLPSVGGGIDAVLVKSARSPLVLSETVAAILDRQPGPETARG